MTLQSLLRTATSLIQLQPAESFLWLADVLPQVCLLALMVIPASDFLWLEHTVFFHSETSCSCLSHHTITHFLLASCWVFHKVIQGDAET